MGSWLRNRKRIRLDIAKAFSERSGIGEADFMRLFYDPTVPPVIGDFDSQYVSDAAVLDEILSALSEATGLERALIRSYFIENGDISSVRGAPPEGGCVFLGEKMKRALAASFFCILAATACRAQISAEGALFYERGHYWIELAFRNEAGRDTIPQHLVPAAFEIAKVGDAAGAFKPSRVQVVTFEGGGSAVILSSGKLEGRACYRVTCKPEGFEPVAIDSICDPFVFAPGASECRGKALFRKYVASAFQKDGDAYSLNQFKYE